LLAHGRWFSPDTPASSTTKTGHHDIAEILLKHQKSKSNLSHNHRQGDSESLYKLLSLLDNQEGLLKSRLLLLK
jgi:hypothetical protein